MSTITKSTRRTETDSEESLHPIPHPGETLKEDFMMPLGLSAYAVAKAVGAYHHSMIIQGKRAISAEMALHLGRYTGIDAQFWMNLQAYYDLDLARSPRLQEINRLVAPLAHPDLQNAA